VTGTEKANGQTKDTAGFPCEPAPTHPIAFAESEANRSIIEAYRYQHHKIMGFYPTVNSQKDKEAVKKALQSRPRGMTLLSETSAVMKFIETMLPGESLGKLLGRYMNKAILLSSTSKPFINADNQTRVPDPKEEAAVDTPAAAGETGRDTAPGQEYKAQGTKTPAVPEDNDREALFEAVAEEYLSNAGRSRIMKDVSLSGERLKYREYLKPFMERKISSIMPFEVKELLAGMHRKGCLAEEGETVYKIFCGIITRASDGKYAGFLDTEILRIDPLNLFAIFDGEKTRLPSVQERFAEQVPVVSVSLLTKVELLEKERQSAVKAGKEERPIDHLAREAGMAPDTYRAAKYILENAHPDIIEMVRKNELAVHTARRIIKNLSLDAQRKLAAKGRLAIKAAANGFQARNKTDIKGEGRGVSTENAETKEQIADLLARVNELEKKIAKKIAFTPDPLRKPPDPGKYVSAREFYQMIREGRRVG